MPCRLKISGKISKKLHLFIEKMTKLCEFLMFIYVYMGWIGLERMYLLIKVNVSEASTLLIQVLFRDLSRVVRPPLHPYVWAQ